VLLTAGGLAALAVLLLGPAPLALARARWVRAEPRAALVLWQSLGLAAGLAAVGAAVVVSLRPLGGTLPAALAGAFADIAAGHPLARLAVPGALLLAAGLTLLGWLLTVTALSAWRTAHARRRHRELVDLVSTDRPDVAARIVEHPAATAYCLPGGDARVVVTTGALELLPRPELDAVLAHENAHLAERHDLLLLPFTAWASALGWLVGPRRARQAVGRLVEMVADDRACAGREPHVLAAALARIGASGAAAHTLYPDAAATASAAPAAVLERVHRLLDPPGRSRVARAAAYVGAAALLAVPTLILLLPALGNAPP
jgi:Zn-dependent protease with chaperone function